MFGIGIGIMVFGYWRLFKWNRERRQEFLDYVIQLNVLAYQSQAGAHSDVCFCATDAYILKRWKPG